MADNPRIELNFPVSGFPEYLPQYRAVEIGWLKTIARICESYGYCNIETPSVEAVETLASKGEDVDKEIYALSRLANHDGAAEKARLALHYDLTVPMARYVAKYYSELSFPFKRYQQQRAWRGERPQEGRYREFTQCDIDVIDIDSVSLAYDSEMLRIALDILGALDVGPVRFQVSNRKLIQGLAAHLGLGDGVMLGRILDKIDKLSQDELAARLAGDLGLDSAAIDLCLAFSAIKGNSAAIDNALSSLGVGNALISVGASELCTLLDNSAAAIPAGCEVKGDLSISRGFDYYTGAVYEAKLIDFPLYPTICAGGRYENLVGAFMRKKLPGVGISIGLTRIFTKLLKEGRITPQKPSPTVVLIAHEAADDAARLHALATGLRAGGVNVEVYPDATKLDRQLKYANRKGIPFVWLGRPDGDQLKDMASGAQTPVSPESFLRQFSGGQLSG